MSCVDGGAVANGYYWACMSGDWELLRCDGKWYTTDEISNFSVCELVEDCVVIPVDKPKLTINI